MGLYGGGGGSKDPWADQAKKDQWIRDNRQAALNAQWAIVHPWEVQTNRYNRNLERLQDEAKKAQTKLSGLDYTASLGNLTGLKSASEQRQSALSGLSRPEGSRPSAQRTVQTPWGGQHTYDFSSMWNIHSPADESYASNLSSLISGNVQRANTLHSDHTTKKSAWQAFRDEQNDDIRALQRAYRGYDISDALKGGGVYSSIDLLGDERSQTARFKDNKFMPSDWKGKKTSSYDSLRGNFDQLIGDRVTEEGRIKKYGDDLDDLLGGYEKDVGGYNISHLDELEAMEDKLRTAERGAKRFSSLLPFDFSTQQEMGQDISGDIAQLLQEREEEERRIEDAQDRFRDIAAGYKRSGRYLDTRDLRSIQDLEDEADILREDIGGFKSLLPTDFSKALSTLGGVDDEVASLIARRKSELDALISDAGAYGSKISGTPIYDESALDALMRKIEDNRRDAAEYTGGRAGDATDAFDDQLSAVEARVQDLMNKRRSLESRARSMLGQSKLGYYNTGQLDASADALERLRGDIELYGADSAYDELDLILAQIAKERDRLGADASAKSAAEQAADSRMLPRSFGLGGPMTAAEYQALIKKKEEDDTPTTSSAFGTLV